MLRALLERDVRPDLILGTSVGALNGALVAADPTPAVVRAAGGAVGERREQRRRVRRRAGAPGQPGRPHRHPPALGQAAARPAGRRSSVTSRSRSCRAVPVLRGQHRAGRRALVHPGRVTDAVMASRGGAGAAPPGGGRRRALPRRRHRQLHPGRPGRRVRRRPGLRAPGRPRRPSADACPPSRGRSPGSPSRSRGGTGSTARWPSLPEHVTAHVLPTGSSGGRRDDSLLSYRDFAAVVRRIDAAYDASSAYLREHL